MTEKTMPPLPSGSVDLSALHKAEAEGKGLADALKGAVVRAKPRKASDKRLARLAAREKAAAKANDGLAPAKPTPTSPPAASRRAD